VDGNSYQLKWQQNQPNKWVKDQRRERERPG
jgi:hypothetical protein